MLTALLTGASATPAFAEEMTKEVVIDNKSNQEVNASDTTGSLEGNKVTVTKDGTASSVSGAWTDGNGTVKNNQVIIDGGTVRGNVTGGHSEEGGATDNTVTLAGGTINGNVYGGYSTDGAATGNTITLQVGADGKTTAFDTVSILYGGGKDSGNTTDDVVSGNTLTIDGVKGITLANIENFSNYNFYLPAGLTTNDVILHLTTTQTTDLSNSNLSFKVNSAQNLHKGDTFTLIQKDSDSLNSGKNECSEVSGPIGVAASFRSIVQKTGNNLVLSITDVAPTADAKSMVETRATQGVAVNMGSDYLAGTTMAQVANASFGSDGFASFGGSSASAMRYETGSYVDAKGVAFNAGIVKKTPNRYGTLSWGPFFETGHSSYDSYLDDGTHGSGSASYTGGGLLARQELAGGLYLEGSLRYGRTKADYSGLTSYDTS